MALPNTQTQQFFTKNLLYWHAATNQRSMPWKGEKDPYKIWLSEVILQQTRVEQGLAYYNKFIIAYPTITALANAKDDDVFKLWEGLGYYSRCKNLLHTARVVSNDYNGIFPTDYSDIIKLKGIGKYTAAAIASFAYKQPYAVVDGNVYRILARVFNIKTAIDSTKGKQQFEQLAQTLLSKLQPALHNQAIMDLGATVCKPQKPLCDVCPLQKICMAYKQNKIQQLPFKQNKIAVTTRWFYFLVVQHKNKVLIGKRTKKDIWQNLHQFFLIEELKELSITSPQIDYWLKQKLDYQKKYTINFISNPLQQKLTHRIIKGRFLHIKLNKEISVDEYSWVTIDTVGNLSFPKFINGFLNSTQISW